MPKYIALLRGVNVGGHGKLKMADLRNACENDGLQNVETYLQSGNLVFRCKLPTGPKVADRLEALLLNSFDLSTPVIIRTPADFKRIVESNPFAPIAKKDPTKVSVMFLASRPPANLVKALDQIDAKGDQFILTRQEIYLHYPNGVGRSKLTNPLFERHLKTQATARNWNTVQALHEMTA